MLRQGARYRVLLTRAYYAAQQGGRPGGLVLEARPAGPGAPRHASSGGRREDDSFTSRIMKG